MKLNNKGFSLIELMVVVAIIGVLASIGMPQLSKFIAKSKQSEAKASLGALYSAEKALFAEFQGYTNVFHLMGFAPDGNLRYDVGFLAASAAVIPAGAGTPANADKGQSAAEFCPQFGGCSFIAAVTVTNAQWGDPTTTTFNATAEGIIGGAGNDIWRIDQAKNLLNTVSGL